MSLEVTINVPNTLLYLILGITPYGEDSYEGGGDSRLVWFKPTHPFHSAFLIHDKWYRMDSNAREEGWTRDKVDTKTFLLMVQLSWGDVELMQDAATIFLLIRKYGQEWWDT